VIHNFDIVKDKTRISKNNSVENNIVEIEDYIGEDNIGEDNIVNENIVETSLTEDEKINMKYCQARTCSFMFPYFQPEQETRSNLHTRTYTQLARSLNRTMVLANVGNSRIQVCKPHPFSFYYDIEALRKQYPDVRFITQEKFLEWTKERKIRPTAQHSLMVQDGKNTTDGLCPQEKKTMGFNEGVKIFAEKR
ncbi:6225_t:CDS:1, partial [Scutellospora calospora]